MVSRGPRQVESRERASAEHGRSFGGRPQRTFTSGLLPIPKCLEADRPCRGRAGRVAAASSVGITLPKPMQSR